MIINDKSKHLKQLTGNAALDGKIQYKSTI